MSSETPRNQTRHPAQARRKHPVLEIDQDKVMIDIERGAYFGMNPVAGEIWEMLEASHTPQQVIEKLLAEYEIDAETCQTETLAVLQRMARLKLVEVK
jgi:hypothetical protein